MTKVIIPLMLYAMTNSPPKLQLPQQKYIIPDFETNWFKAGEYCNNQGLRLAIVNNREDEMDVLKEAQNKNWNTFCLWIGASDLGQAGVFTWQATGNPVNYSNWDEENPDNWNGNEHCVQLRVSVAGKIDKMWNDLDCAEVKHFICENKNNVK